MKISLHITSRFVHWRVLCRDGGDELGDRCLQQVADLHTWWETLGPDSASLTEDPVFVLFSSFVQQTAVICVSLFPKDKEKTSNIQIAPTANTAQRLPPNLRALGS